MTRTHRFEIACLVAVICGGAALRISQLDQSLFGDELWTWVGATKPAFGGMLDWVYGDQEITPPLFTALAWASVRLGDDRLLIDLPSLVAGIATIPLVFAIARVIFDRRVALVAATFAALSPGLAFFSVEARAYALVIALVAASTLAMLMATDEKRSSWWWAAYAAFTAAAMYTHYTAAFVLFTQLVWLLWFRPAVRKRALLATTAAAVAFAPWIPGVLADFHSPARANHELLAPFGLHNFVSFAGTFAFGHPWASLGRPSIGLHEFLGGWAEAALFGGLAVAAIGAGVGYRNRRGSSVTGAAEPSVEGGWRRDHVLLIVALAIAAPAGTTLVSLVSDDQYLPRNLMTSLPALLIACAALIVAAPPVFRAVALVLTLGAFGYGAVSMLEPQWQRPDVRSAAAVLDRDATPDDVILDAIWFDGQMPEGYSAPPLALTLDVHLDTPLTPTDALTASDVEGAARAAEGHRLWIVGPPALVDAIRAAIPGNVGAPVVQETFEGLIDTEVVALPIPSSALPPPR